MTSLRIGAAGWQTIRAINGPDAEAPDSLRRYAQLFDCVEINSSFFRAPSALTFSKWANKTPPSFRFSVRVPEAITHAANPMWRRIELFKEFVQAAGNLGDKLGVFVFVLSDDMAFDETSRRLVVGMRSVSDASFAFQPAHPSWLTKEADTFFEAQRIGVVTVPGGSRLGSREVRGWTSFQYWRLHTGAIDLSSENANRLLVHRKAFAATETWLIGDNCSHAAALRRAAFDPPPQPSNPQCAVPQVSMKSHGRQGPLASAEAVEPPTYHLYFLRGDGAVSHVLAIPFDDAQGAALWVNQHKHEHTIEIWRDSKLMFVSPGVDRRHEKRGTHAART